MAKNNDITIENWFKGLTPSAYVGGGFADIQCVDVMSILGIARAGNVLAKLNTAGTTLDTRIKKILKSGTTYYYIGETSDTGEVWKAAAGSFSVVRNGTIDYVDGVIYNGYLLLPRGAYIDAIDLTDDSYSAASFGGANFSNGTWKTILEDNDSVYYASGNQVASIAPGTGTFDPDSAGTYTLTTDAFVLPTYYDIFSINLVGEYLAIVAKNKNTGRVEVFYWDKVDEDDNYITKCDLSIMPQACISDSGWLYYIGGENGDIYRTQGMQNQYITTVPETIIKRSKTGGKWGGFNMYKNAIAVGNSKIYFGTSTNGYYCLASVWSLDTRTFVLSREYIISRSSSSIENIIKPAGGSEIKIHSLFVESDAMRVSSYNGNESSEKYRIDHLNPMVGESTIENYAAYIDTTMMFLSNNVNISITPQGISLFFAKPLATGDKCKIGYRTSDDLITDSGITRTSYTEIAEISGGSVQSKFVPFALTLKNVQFRIYLEGNTYLRKMVLHIP